jgi:beta-glucosidase/6-phospho-beta-glucosidase/beta-galactosidase
MSASSRQRNSRMLAHSSAAIKPGAASDVVNDKGIRHFSTVIFHWAANRAKPIMTIDH